MKSMTIGQVAIQAGVGVETIRFYERRGLIEEPPRRDSGYREYPQEAVTRLRFIKHAQRLGFTLAEISELLSLRVDPNTSCADIKGLAEAKIADIEGRIQALEKMKSVLLDLNAQCGGRGSTSECPILEALETEECC
ncbi:MAG: MerR family DNA-binding protein [Armatimonadetes bacterium]|nr:MerR family DNA-binding protein [Armatimonadota bacterium]